MLLADKDPTCVSLLQSSGTLLPHIVRKNDRVDLTVAPKNGAILAGRKGPAMWLRYGQPSAQPGQM
jgi:hypothetical protein